MNAQQSHKLEQAREAFQKKDIELAKNVHKTNGQKLEDGVILELEAKPATEEKNPLQEHEENHVKGGEFLKSMLYGGFDGILTTFALMMSLLASGEENSTKILALGIANLIADGISMGVADFFSSKSEQEMTIKERDRETWEVQNNIEGEKQEMYEIYVEKGMLKEDAREITNILAKNPKAFVDIMMVEELGLLYDDSNPVFNGLVTFCSFVVFGIVPICPYIYGAIAKAPNHLNLWLTSIIMTVITLFLLGLGKAQFSQLPWYNSSGQTVLVGSLAAASSYLINLAFTGVTN